MAILITIGCLVSIPTFSNGNEITTLRVLLYPFVPNRLALFQTIEASFERDNPGVNLELVDDRDLLSTYYTGGLLKASADVYEVDTIMLADLANSSKIVPLDLPSVDFYKEAIKAVTRNNSIYAVPHWVCGNFLFFKKGDKEIEDAESWTELLRIIKNRNQSLFIDLKGKSTLGEWYLTVLSEIDGLEAAQKSILESDAPRPSVVSLLTTVLDVCPDGFCRNRDLHDRTGYYARAFISGKSIAYIGYSESISYGIQYSLDNCTSTSGCLSINDIAVKRLPYFVENPKNKGIGWVDGLAIDSKLNGHKKELAIKLINYLVSEEAYTSILKPEWMQAPPYLMPARVSLNIKGAPLYHSFYNAFYGRETGTMVGLNDRLIRIGTNLNCALPIGRTDNESQNECHK